MHAHHNTNISKTSIILTFMYFIVLMYIYAKNSTETVLGIFLTDFSTNFVPEINTLHGLPVKQMCQCNLLVSFWVFISSRGFFDRFLNKLCARN